MQLRLKYGRRGVAFDVSEDFLAGYHCAADLEAPEAPPTRDELCQRALHELRESGLCERARGRRLGLLFSDATRTHVGEVLWGPLLEELRGCLEVVAFFCTGTHSEETPENCELMERIARALERAPVPARLVVNDALSGEHEYLGVTPHGTRIEVHPELLSCDLYLVLSDMRHHYFAGYSNPLKSFLPGMASFESARGNHALAMHPDSAAGVHPWHPDPARRDNPLAVDLLEAWLRITGAKDCFALPTVARGEHLLWAGGGLAPEVAGRAMLECDKRAFLTVEPTRYLVVSTGGDPFDESLYQAQRALELTRAALREGGEVLWLARCPNGIGPPSARKNFVDRLAQPLADVLAGFEGEYVLYSHKAYKFADYLRRVSAVWVHTELDAAEVERIHLRVAREPQAVVERWAAEREPGDRVRFIDDASKLVLR